MHSARAVIVIYEGTRKEQQGVKEADDRTKEERNKDEVLEEVLEL